MQNPNPIKPLLSLSSPSTTTTKNSKIQTPPLNLMLKIILYCLTNPPIQNHINPTNLPQVSQISSYTLTI
ncbi:hypothetical protein GLYMA_19G043100v4 [Glycine max]|uniref:Uncharacterized protein n=2 Tax=Glycine subgen. Soja TaxID=1462606 RepID=A0A0R0EI50_SOYBN|nr:hypothetical protein JHK87_052391 [Glycine soja]KAG4926679.1 hypothetical protein JHK85_053165 [Glycine max]KAG5082313.1 hypothetical protein JHK84_052351 [Glycine max]KAH1076359.1 hypothetical protein GYH30_052019 [Glycine max]KRG93814.1 hypothetical protein GLYMA_19G043100v4 [Glycine max]